MTTEWAIAIVSLLVGLLQVICIGVMGFILNKLERVSDHLYEYMPHTTCSEKMRQHYEEIQNIWENVRKNSEDIAGIKGSSLYKE